MITRQRVNELLLSKYGKAIDRDLPKFRVVRAEEETERRLGDFALVGLDGKPIGTESCIKTVQKYPFLGPCWVLEMYCGVPDQTVRDAVQASYTYEPLYVLLGPNEEELELSWLPIEMAVKFYFEAKDAPKLTDSDLQAIEDAKLKKEQELAFEELGGKYSIADALSHKQGVAINDTTNLLVEEKSNV